MAKKSKSKPSSEESNDSADIFKVLFGREAPEEQGLGLHAVSTTTDLDAVKKKKNKKPEKSDLDANLPETIAHDAEKKRKKKKDEVNAESGVEAIDEEEVKAKKSKRKKEVIPISDVDLVAEDEVSKRKKEGQLESNDLVVENGVGKEGEGIVDVKETKKKKKRKKDEIETAYETKTYGLVPDVEAKKVGEKRKTMDEQPELKVAREGFDDEDKLLRTVFVGNLPLKLKKKALIAEFSKFGEVESVRIRSVPIVNSKTPRKGAIMKGKINEAVDSVHAYIVFKDEKSAQASLSHNMAVVGGNHIRVDRACPPRKKLKGDSTPLYDNQRTVFVGNLPFDVKDEEIYQLFCGMDQVESNIEGVRVIRDPNSSVGKGIAYVLFKTREAANLVIRKRNLKIRDRPLRLYHAKADATPSKKVNQPTSSTDGSSGKRYPVTPSGSRQDKSNSKIKSALSYQGLKGSKSIQKKEGQNKDGFRPRSGEKRKQMPRTASGPVVKQRDSKRPAVAARKAKALKGAGASGQTGVKRKPDSRTPDSFHRNKKARKM